MGISLSWTRLPPPPVLSEEVLLLVGFLWRIDTDDGWAVRTTRMLDVVMEGLAVTAPASA
jgi:hypothetical protein